MHADPRVDEVLGFWFGTTPEEASKARARWFARDAAFDELIRSRFGALYDSIGQGGLDAWIGTTTRTPESMLAYVVVLDQFSRNLFRDSSRAFEYDASALAATEAAIADGLDRSLSLVQRYMLFMPLMHAESAEAQRRSIATFARLRDEAAGAADASMYQNALDYAESHARIVVRFGRFPHRNRLLDRTTTADEAQFLLEPGSSF